MLAEILQGTPDVLQKVVFAQRLTEKSASKKITLDEITTHAVVIGNCDNIKLLCEAGFFDDIVIDFKLRSHGSASDKCQVFFKNLEIYYNRSQGDAATCCEIVKTVFADVFARGLGELLEPYFNEEIHHIFEQLKKDLSPESFAKNPAPLAKSSSAENLATQQVSSVRPRSFSI